MSSSIVYGVHAVAGRLQQAPEQGARMFRGKTKFQEALLRRFRRRDAASLDIVEAAGAALLPFGDSHALGDAVARNGCIHVAPALLWN